MGEFVDRTLSRVPAGIELPEALRLLFAWVEDRDLVVRGRDGDLYGALSAPSPGPGTSVELRAFPPDELDAYRAAWFGRPDPAVWPFCRTGADGSYAALWRGPDGRTVVVHLGSGSGSTLACVLAEDAVDFLRLLAIGYDELCWAEDWPVPPQPVEPGRSVTNEPYRSWVEATFETTIPATASELVPRPAYMDDEDSPDSFCRWVAVVTAVEPTTSSGPASDTATDDGNHGGRDASDLTLWPAGGHDG